ncbi:MAG: DUF4249 domain-containing protein [Ginsengibacter sp.]
MIQKYFLGGWIFPVIITLFFASCKDPYFPNVNSSKAHYLVVDGYINSNGLTNVKLTRTRTISKGDTAAYINETGANIAIQDNQNNVYPLQEIGGGNYSSSNFLDVNNKYRLHIITSDNKVYVSDFVPCKISPSIDNVGWKLQDGNVQVFVNTHDPNNHTTYYRWDYAETWEFHSEYYSTLIYNTDSNIVENRSAPVYVCYRSDNIGSLFLGSSAKLKEDVIHESPLELIPDHDRRISVLYSALVTQYALDSNAYSYWSAMKGNTEDVGSIFGNQPNQTRGNIHSMSDSSEIVVGYIGAGSPQQARIFISNADVPNGWNQPQNCTEKYVPPDPDSIKYFFGSNAFIPYASNPPGSPVAKGYFSASATCVDCSLTGTLVKPAFWP